MQSNTSPLSYFMKGSATCSATSWVPCPTCDCLDESESSQYGRLPANRCAISNVGNETMVFALKNECDGTKWQLPASNYGTVIFMLFAVMLLGMYLRREEVKFDEDEQTAQDYSIQITNPPDDAKDPDEWRHFFNENCDGVQVTVYVVPIYVVPIYIVLQGMNGLI